MSGLAALIRRTIRDRGPLDVGAYMQLVMGHPTLGYYATRDPFGREGDFVTAPEISQMFGELVGACLADCWARAGKPATARYVELGPGRGTLAADALRAMRPAGIDPPVHFVETSPVLRTTQRETLRCSPAPLAWYESLEDVPQGPLIVIANEFIDALPVRQFVREHNAWHERCVTLGAKGAFAFCAGI